MHRSLGTLLVVAVLLCASGLAAARDSILWAATDFPPFQIREGPYRDTGSFDGLMDLLIAQLPEYDHEVVTMTLARREEEMREGHRFCTPGIYRTAEREQYLTFSVPSLVHLANGLVFLKSRSAEFPAGESVDLDSVLARKDLVGGILAQRSFAPNIDALVRKHANQPNLVLRPVKSSQFIEMLIHREIDYTILFPHEAAYLARQFPNAPELAFRPIAGTPPYSITMVACTKGAWGQSVIDRINRVIRSQVLQPDYRALSERWYPDQGKALVRRYYPELTRSP